MHELKPSFVGVALSSYCGISQSLFKFIYTNNRVKSHKMQKFAFLAIISVIASSTVALEDFKPDLVRPIYKIRDQITVTRDKPPVWSDLPKLIAAILPCLNSNSTIKLDTSGLLPDLEAYLQQTNAAALVREITSLVNWNEVSTKGSNKQTDDSLWEDLKAFMATDEFIDIHNHLWSHGEFLDLIGYFYNGGFINTYEQIRYFYEYMGQLNLANGAVPVPTQPPTYGKNINSRGVRTEYHSSSPAFPFQLNSPIINAENESNCNFLEILGLVGSSRIISVVNIFMYALEEVTGDAAMHVLLLKIGEKQKGDFFKETMELPQIQEVFPLVQRVVLAEEWVHQLNFILHEVTGLTLENTELFMYFVKLIQYLVWGHPF
ncbi:hypothetical protein Ocin01_06652 [Orchesella cincta]|uniref:Uncharacterized protein n=1 Tax=Orchesella cincta TaxID=48709 RepID=A0A1D2N419_ORCCI|nr:hypothetical protein Ocin01_06652 [Orchesella cincta]